MLGENDVSSNPEAIEVTPKQQSGSQSCLPAIVYDGDCPFCRWYVGHFVLADGADLVNARKDAVLVEQLTREGIDIDRDMVLIDQGLAYKGADALNRLAHSHSQQGGWFNRSHVMLFRWRPLAIVIYPVLRFLRNVYLRTVGRPSIH